MMPSPYFQLRPYGEKKFYDPDRDLVYAFSKLMSKALNRWFTNWEPRPNCSREQLDFAAKEIAKLTNDVLGSQLSPEEVIKRITEIEKEGKEPFRLISVAFLIEVFIQLTEWFPRIVAKTPSDYVVEKLTGPIRID